MFKRLINEIYTEYFKTKGWKKLIITAIWVGKIQKRFS